LPPNPPSVTAECTNRYRDFNSKEHTQSLIAWYRSLARPLARSRVSWNIATKVCVKPVVNAQRERNLGQFPFGRATADDDDGPEGSGVHSSPSFKISFMCHKCPSSANLWMSTPRYA
jgi:hypothetical protein